MCVHIYDIFLHAACASYINSYSLPQPDSLFDGDFFVMIPSRCRADCVCYKVFLFWLVVWNMTFMTFRILGISSPQLTNSIIFQRGRAQPPTR